MGKSSTYSSSPMGNLGILPSFDPSAFSDFINGNGIPIVHFKAVPCPVGQSDAFDTVHKSHLPGHNCSNGYVFIKAGDMVATFNNNPNSTNVEDIGIFTGSTVQITFPFFYCDGVTPVTVAIQDRFYLRDIECTVTSLERITRSNGIVDFTDFPPTNIEYIIDNTGKLYDPSCYTIQDSSLVWIGDRPAADAVCAIRYNYKPYLYAERLLHEIRVARVEDMDGGRSLTRMPYAAICQRENIGRTQVTNLHPNQLIPPRSQLPPDRANNNLLSGNIPLPHTGSNS